MSIDPVVALTKPSDSDQKSRYTDVRIGSPRTGAGRIHLDYHRRTGNLFAMIERLGVRCVGAYGLAYMAGETNVPNFDLASERGFFCDGFESGTTSAWN